MKSMKIHLIYVGVSKTLGMSPTIGLKAEKHGFSVEQQVLPIWLWVRTCENSGYQKVEEPPRCRVNYLKMCSDISNHAHVGLHPSADLFWELPNCSNQEPREEKKSWAGQLSCPPAWVPLSSFDDQKLIQTPKIGSYDSEEDHFLVLAWGFLEAFPLNSLWCFCTA